MKLANMKVFSVEDSERARIYRELKNFLYNREETVFSYIYGSFPSGSFRDLDICVYIRSPLRGREGLEYELSLEIKLEDLTKFPVDVRIIDNVPLSLKFNIIKNGLLLFSKDENIRREFECLTLKKFHDFKFYLNEYRRVAIGLGV